MTKKAKDLRSAANSWRTPPDLFARLMPDGADLDAFATAENSLASAFLEDAFDQDWYGRVWVNPPFDACGEAVARAWFEWSWSLERDRPVESITMLLPANRTEQSWWATLVEPYRDRPGRPLTVEFLAGRVRFLRPDGQPGPNPRFGCAVLRWTRRED